MVDLMNRNEYRDACRYRVRETLEILTKIWDKDIDEEVATIDNLEKTETILAHTVDELKYFKEKILTTENFID